jgi:hypothetical protein
MPETTLPKELMSLYYFMTGAKEFTGSNTELAEYLGKDVNPKGLKQMMNRHRYTGLIKCGDCGSSFTCQTRRWKDQPERYEYVCNG